MARMQKAGIIAVSDDGNPVLNGSVMRLAMEYADGFNILVISHCEDKSITDGGVVNEGFNATKCGLKGINRVAEESMVARELLFADALKCRVHIAHVSTKGSVNLVRLFKSMGVRVTCETCPHYFALNDDMILNFDTTTKVNPPLREENDRLSIIEGIIDGTIDCIATDHAPHHIDDKRVEYNSASFGISGLETAFSIAVTYLLKTNYIDIVKLNQLMSLRPSKILGLYDEGIKVNAPADLTICNLDKEYVIDSSKFISKGKNTPFNNMKVKGVVTHTIINGKLVYKDGELLNG
jgi:dihydroorotase